MSFLTNLFGRKSKSIAVDGVEDFSALIRVYFQASLATILGINNPRFMPDVIQFKRSFKIVTQKNKLGVAERTVCRKMLMADYGLSNMFFKEIDSSIKKNCRNQNEINQYLQFYQAFSNEIMMLVGNLMQWKMRIPAMFRKMLYSVTKDTVHDIYTKTVWKDDGVHKTARQVRELATRLQFSEQWSTDFVFTLVLLVKRDSKNNKNKIDEKEK